jgi:hypothetical protein
MRGAAAFLVAAVSLLCAAPALAAGYANPGAVIAAEAAFQRLAREKGRWTAALDMAAPGAKLFEPEPVLAAIWLKDRANPATPPVWQPHEVWSSCDGSFAVTRGGWQDGGQSGRFVTLWQRQEDGGYKWVLRLERPLAEPVPAPEMIAAKVAQCPVAKAEEDRPAPPPTGKPPRKRKPEAPLPLFDPLVGKSGDGTLEWRSGVDTLGAPYFTFAVKTDGAMPEQSPAL